MEGPKTRKLRLRAEKRAHLRANPPAAEALRKAMAWERDIAERGFRRADIARREQLTRARVTQLMSLLRLPADVRERVLAGGEPRTIRGAMEAVPPRETMRR